MKFISFENWIKESFENSLLEIGEANVKPYPLEKRVHGEYRFETEDGDKYAIKFQTEEQFPDKEEPYKIAYVAFYTGENLSDPKRADLDRVINKGRILRILPTIIEAIKLYLKDYQKYMDEKTFRVPLKYIAMIPGKNDPKDNRRLNIYKAYINKLLPEANIILSKLEFEDKLYDTLIIDINDIKL